MGMQVRVIMEEERATIEQWIHSRTLPAGKVTRAKIIWQAAQGASIPEIAQRLDLCVTTARLWLSRFNALGIPGLEESPRTGRPLVYPPEQVAIVIATALQRPQALGLSFVAWTLDRLVAYLHEEQGISMKRSRISEIFLAEGLGWRHEETWFGERVDPDFAEKRGPLRPSTPPRPRKVSLSASTN